MNPRVPFLAIATRIFSRGKIWWNYERLTRVALRHQESACWVVHYASTVGVNVLNAQRKCTAFDAGQRAWQNTVNSSRVCNAQCAWSTLHGISVNLTRLAFYVMIIGPGCVHGPMHTHTQCWVMMMITTIMMVTTSSLPSSGIICHFCVIHPFFQWSFKQAL